MKDSKHALQRLATDETGVTSIEYALTASLIAIVCLVAAGSVGGNVTALFTGVCNKVSVAISGTPSC